MSSTEPQNKAGSKRRSSALRSLRIKSTHIKIAACTVLAAAVGVTGTICIAGNPNSSEMMTRSLVEGLNSSAINPKYIDKVTFAYSETTPTEPQTNAAKTSKKESKSEQTKTKKSDKKDKEKSKEKSTKKTTKKATEKKQDKTESVKAPTDPTVSVTEANTSDSTQSKPSNITSNQTAITDPETSAPTTEEESIAKEMLYQQQWDAGYLMAIDNPDYSYSPKPVKLSDKEYNLICRTVMREMGHQGYIGIAMVAQAFRDAMNTEDYNAFEVVEKFGYKGATPLEPNQETIDAVNFIFKENGSAVQHRILFYYATWGTSEWHESQNFIVQYGCTRFFDRWY
ncbi:MULTISPECIES: hypothetical protein [unclassified Ruminococcus]|uniref:hypothetical protein n=1 Tax=unclassified Ruminococcus TaxID=2608920 RepID=UPI00210CFD57|nr:MULTISPECIES: hypothetical protein [unclassified Ruminococcus]MCQ4023293.1 hypothetical protein [Ruminococcus sp. zg-924]MCQ4115636.1 hypothetical protein [Ruminococcus sp. zg-921]